MFFKHIKIIFAVSWDTEDWRNGYWKLSFAITILMNKLSLGEHKRYPKKLT